jgi:uroporphyrinogen decarboxylase
VQAAIRREPADRVPVFMWFHPVTAARLGRLLEIPPSRVSQAMGDDIAQIWVNNNYAMEGVVHEHDGERHTDFWGITWEKQGPFNQIVHLPLADATPEQLLAYKFPYEHLEELLAPMAKLADNVARASCPCVPGASRPWGTTDSEDHGQDAHATRGQDAHATFLGCDVSPCVFEMYWRLRGMEGTFLDMAAEPALSDEMFRRCADFAERLSVESCRRFKLDWLWTGDDVAGQLGMMMSPQQWRELVKPHMARVVKVGKDAGLPVAYHCCGGLRPIIGDLIEIGIDVLNPVQCNCAGMEPLELKKDFGGRLAFMGGVDTQSVLPHGTAAEVRRDTARLIEGMTQGGGGYILAASHTVPPETPDENIFAMYEVAGISRQEIFDRAAEIRKEQITRQRKS